MTKTVLTILIEYMVERVGVLRETESKFGQSEYIDGAKGELVLVLDKAISLLPDEKGQLGHYAELLEQYQPREGYKSLKEVDEERIKNEANTPQP